MSTKSHFLVPIRKSVADNDSKMRIWFCEGLPLCITHSRKDPHHIRVVALYKDVQLGYVGTVYFDILLDVARKVLWQARYPFGLHHLVHLKFRVSVRVTGFLYCFKPLFARLGKAVAFLPGKNKKNVQNRSFSHDLDAPPDPETLALTEKIEKTSVSVESKIRVIEPDGNPLHTWVHVPESVCVLDEDELQTLTIAISGAKSTFAEALTSHYVAIPYAQIAKGQRHLMEGSRYNRRGPALCGCLPPTSSTPSLFNGQWLLIPFFPPRHSVPTCSQCLKIFRDQGHLDPKVIEAALFKKKHDLEEEAGWNEA